MSDGTRNRNLCNPCADHGVGRIARRGGAAADEPWKRTVLTTVAALTALEFEVRA
jgi:hypothetical protein